jgi:hypothetical protein
VRELSTLELKGRYNENEKIGYLKNFWNLIKIERGWQANAITFSFLLLLLFVRAQGICPRCTSACRHIVLP